MCGFAASVFLCRIAGRPCSLICQLRLTYCVVSCFTRPIGSEWMVSTSRPLYQAGLIILEFTVQIRKQHNGDRKRLGIYRLHVESKRRQVRALRTATRGGLVPGKARSRRRAEPHVLLRLTLSQVARAVAARHRVGRRTFARHAGRVKGCMAHCRVPQNVARARLQR